MRYILLVPILFSAMVSFAAFAKETTETKMPAPSLDQRYALCMSDPSCTEETKTQLLQEAEKKNKALADKMQAKTNKKKTPKDLSEVEPAAGYKPDPYTRPDLEQMDRQKRQWWKDWTPSNDSNPYHKW